MPGRNLTASAPSIRGNVSVPRYVILLLLFVHVCWVRLAVNLPWDLSSIHGKGKVLCIDSAGGLWLDLLHITPVKNEMV